MDANKKTQQTQQEGAAKATTEQRSALTLGAEVSPRAVSKSFLDALRGTGARESFIDALACDADSTKRHF